MTCMYYVRQPDKPLSQAMYVCLLLLRLKKYRAPWLTLVLVASMSNLFIYSLINDWTGNVGNALNSIRAVDFVWSSAILMDYNENPTAAMVIHDNLIKREKLSNESVRFFFTTCKAKAGCADKVFKLLYGLSNSSKYTGYVDYDEASVPSVTCQIAMGADLQCPFFGHLAATSHNQTLYLSKNTFGSVRFFSLTAHAERRLPNPAMSFDTLCGRHNNFDPVISRTIMIQTMLLIGTTFFYFLVGTVSCIVDLKKNGFLKIMFQKGLSVRSYWIAVWSVTSFEILIIASLLFISHKLQCPTYYKAVSMFTVYVATVFQLSGIAALGFLLTVVMQKFFHIGLAMVLFAICSCVAIFINRLVLPAVYWPKFVLLFLVPLGQLSEFTRAHLLAVILPDSLTLYHHLILTVSLLFPILVTAVTLYFDFIVPTGNGHCLNWGFIFDKRFWTTQTSQNDSAEVDPLADEVPPDLANVEPAPEGLRPIVRIRGLSKHYSTTSCFSTDKQVTVALTNISAHIYESHITAIIGHNGSGKTTLLNILNGSDLPTHGQVSVDGMLVNDPINRMRLRKIIGICPQENSLSSALTVQQTLEMALVSCSKGFAESQASMQKLLSEIRMTSKRNIVVDNISCGMRRKLCTAVALIGDSKLLFLDEPTSGVDPVSKIRIWKLLQEYKLKCSIILSTQSMDEADTLADRKIFLSGGSLICAGSSLFLKSAFDCGFDFNVTLKSATHAPLLIQHVQQEFKSVRVKNQFQRNVDFHLPAADLNFLPALAHALERRKEWILAFGLLQASLYDIFMRLRDLQPAEVENLFQAGSIGLVQQDESNKCREGENARLQTLLAASEKVLCRSSYQSFRSMAYINLIRVWRSRVKFGSRIAAPMVLLTVLFAMAFVEKGIDNAKLHLQSSLTNYGEGFTKGICVFEAGAVANLSLDTECRKFLNFSARENTKVLVLNMPSGVDPYNYLVDPARMEKIKSLCHSPGKQPVECPVVYVDNWRKTVSNAERTVYVGSFGTFENFNSSAAASVTIGAYYRLLRYFLADGFNSGKISPMAFKFLAKSVYEFRSMFIPLYGIFFQLIIISILPATFLDDLIEDKETKVRNQLSSIGMRRVSYWVTMYCVHWLQYAVIYLISVIFVIAINSNGYANSFYLAGIVLPTLFFGLSNNQLTVYILSSLLNKSNPIVTVAYFFFSVFLVIIVLAVQLDNVAGVILIALVPPFASIALTFYGTKAIFYTLSFFKVDRLGSAGTVGSTIYFFQPHIFASFVAVMVHSVVLVLILFIMEQRSIVAEFLRPASLNEEAEPFQAEVDDGVIDEEESLYNVPRNSDHLFEIRHMRMTYPNGAKVIRDLSFAASPGEIFGLLGPNGAGKSTTMAVMVGDQRATGGRCEVRCGERWLSSRVAARRGYIGYCPQYDPQYDDVTAREHLEFYACILGVSQSDAKEQIDLLIEGTNLDQHESKLSSQLSFGCKRRLSLAASLLGDPCLLVIDEASTGIDPVGKRFMWRAIRAVANQHRTIVISTHCMEEAEALCSRVSVMNHGFLVGLGSVQQLKSRYGQFYTLDVLLFDNGVEPEEAFEQRKSELITAVCGKFSNSTVVEEFTDRISFSIPLDSIVRLSHALSWITDIKEAFQILYFSFYQMSLDHVFGRMILRHNKMISRERSSSLISVETQRSLTTKRSETESL